MATIRHRITVIGSINVDVALAVPEIPVPGQTLLGGDPVVGPGGKGANQAVAAARLGGRVRLVGRVGDDGAALREGLAREGVDVAATAVGEGPTGRATVLVTAHGENAIVVSPGANARLTPADLPADLGREGEVVLAQLEVPLPTVREALRRARAVGATTVLNPAPMAPLDAALLADVDVLVPNATELAGLVGADEPRTPADAAALAAQVAGPGALVVTLGRLGAVVVRDGAAVHVPAPQVGAVDTVGAGDTLCGALAEALARGDDLVPAVRWAVAAAALSVTRRGAQAGMPDARAVRASLATAGPGPVAVPAPVPSAAPTQP